MEADGRQPEEREYAAHGAACGIEAKARLLRRMQVQAQIALHLLAQPLQQPLLRSGQQLIIICLRITAQSRLQETRGCSTVMQGWSCGMFT